MVRFWDACIAPVLDAMAPRVVVEVGVFEGAHTRRLLADAPSDATVHAVDPAPAFDPAPLVDEHRERLVFHHAPSLDVLATIEHPDLVLIDGDHNWYTVFHELKTLAAANPERFPVVALHDVGWPYGRRDLYYEPARIPDEFRHPHGTGGMLPGESDLAAEGGVNAGKCHALHEGGPRNGVRTALEDFVVDSLLDLEHFVIPGLFGLGFVYLRDLTDTRGRLGETLRSLRPSPGLAAHLEQVEWWRIQADLDAQGLRPRT